MKQIIELKRAYDQAEASDGLRVYIDKLWPRGLSHATFHYDIWEKEISPSTELREWFHADPNERWAEFAERYKKELSGNPAVKELKKQLADKSKVTLLYSSHDRTHNNAIVLKQILLGQ